jgi:hypothetical protein
MGIIALIFFIGIILITAFGLNYSRQKLSKCKTCTSEALEMQNPELQNIKWKYHLPLIGLSLLLIGLFFFFILNAVDKSVVTKLAIPLLMISPIYNSIFGLITGVHPLTTKLNWNNFVYDPDGHFRKTAYIQIAISIACSIIGLVLL